MYCRQHGYPTAPLISYKIQENGRQWAVVVPLSELSTLVAQCPILGHYGFSSNQTDANWSLPRRLPCPQRAGRGFRLLHCGRRLLRYASGVRGICLR